MVEENDPGSQKNVEDMIDSITSYIGNLCFIIEEASEPGAREKLRNLGDKQLNEFEIALNKANIIGLKAFGRNDLIT